MLDLVALLVALLLAATLILRAHQWLRVRQWRRGNDGTGRQPLTHEPQSHAAVGIRTHAHACVAVQKLYGKRFLAEDAPALPVAGCSVRPCPCLYIHFVDRRAEDRRAHLRASDSFESIDGAERRHGDRRHVALPV